MDHYPYEDEHGSVLYRVAKWGDGKNKKFKQEHRENGGWALGRGVPNDWPYRLPEVLHAIATGQPIWIFEGEKDVETGRSNELVATTNSGGQGKWTDAHSEWLSGAQRINICRDRDAQGRSHALKVEASLRRTLGPNVKIVHYRPASGNDFSDHIEAGLEVSDLVKKRPAPVKEAPSSPRSEQKDVDRLPAALQLVVLKAEKLTVESGKEHQWNALCPAHADTSPSLSIALGSSGQTLLKCQAGCSFEAIAEAFDIPVSDLTRKRSAVEMPIIRTLDDYEEKSIEWLWHGRLPLGSMVIIDGDPDKGKSTIMFDIIARMTSGGAFPDDTMVGDPIKVLLMTSEDSIEQRIKPMLRVAGGNTGNVLTHALPRDDKGQVVPFALPDNIQELENTIKATGVKLIMMDPFMGFVGEGVNTAVDASMRKVTGPLADIAERHNICIVGIRHFKKDRGEKSPMYRGGGSIAIIGQARVGHIVGPQPGSDDNTMIFACHKNNLTQAGSVRSLAYRIEGSDEDDRIPVVRWLGLTGVSADDILGGTDARTESPKRDEASEFIDVMLSEEHKGMTVVDFDARMRASGFSDKTARSAFKRAGHHRFQYRSGGKIAGWKVHHKGLRLKNCASCRRMFYVKK